MAEDKIYTGSCHCGKIKFEVQADISGLLSCNCSICSRTGWLLTFVSPDQFKLLSGADVLSDYQFGKKRTHHPFCPDCGIHAFGHGRGPDNKEMYAVNVR